MPIHEDSDPMPLRRDLSEDEPDLLTDDQLKAAIPPLPRLETSPMPPMTQVPPGPETARPAFAEAGEPDGLSLEEAAEAASEGRST